MLTPFRLAETGTEAQMDLQGLPPAFAVGLVGAGTLATGTEELTDKPSIAGATCVQLFRNLCACVASSGSWCNSDVCNACL